jgi:hypothetical protein
MLPLRIGASAICLGGVAADDVLSSKRLLPRPAHDREKRPCLI